jgi:hypothetical protein
MAKLNAKIECKALTIRVSVSVQIAVSALSICLLSTKGKHRYTDL